MSTTTEPYEEYTKREHILNALAVYPDRYQINNEVVLRLPMLQDHTYIKYGLQSRIERFLMRNYNRRYLMICSLNIVNVLEAIRL